MRRVLGGFSAMLVLGAWGAVLAASPHDAARPDTEARLDRFIRAEMERQRIPGVAVGVVMRGEPVLIRGYGYANVEHQAPVKPETVFRVASLTKQFTALAVMLLVQEGRLGLDDPITKHLAGAPKEWQSITIRHLLNHTSGVHDWWEDGYDLRRDLSEDEIAQRAFDHPLDDPPGSRWRYCNAGYDLLGIVVRRVSGQSWGDYLRQRVFTPLGMTTAHVISEEEIVPNRAAGYRLIDGELRNQELIAPSLNTFADGGLHMSLLDLIAWDRALRSKAILSAESWSKVFEPAPLNSGRSYPYGFGWHLDSFAGQTVRWHGGNWEQGFTCYFARFLEDDLTIIVLTNLAQGRPSRLVQGIAPILDPKLVPEDPTPIPDREPAVAARLKEALSLPSTRPGDVLALPFTSFPFYPTGWQEYKAAEPLLRRLGVPKRLELIARRELGDDIVYTYVVRYPDATLWAAIGIAPDGRVSHCAVRIPT